MDILPQITVTHDDLLNGKRGDATNCAIALAAKRVFVDQQVFVTPAVLTVRDRDGERWFSLPPEARKLQKEFDLAPWDDFEHALQDDFKPVTFVLLPYVHKKRTRSTAQELGLPIGFVLPADSRSFSSE